MPKNDSETTALRNSRHVRGKHWDFEHPGPDEIGDELPTGHVRITAAGVFWTAAVLIVVLGVPAVILYAFITTR